jgi:hypothetical protein
MNDYKPGWWSRNWKWFVPVGCLTMVLLFVLAIAALVFGVFGLMKQSTVYTQAVAEARAHPAVAEAMGSPIEEGTFVSGNFEESGPSGSASLSIPLSGPKGDGTLYVEAKKSAGQWTFSTLVLQAPDASRIDLLAGANTNEPQAMPTVPALQDEALPTFVDTYSERECRCVEQGECPTADAFEGESEDRGFQCRWVDRGSMLAECSYENRFRPDGGDWSSWAGTIVRFRRADDKGWCWTERSPASPDPQLE